MLYHVRLHCITLLLMVFPYFSSCERFTEESVNDAGQTFIVLKSVNLCQSIHMSFWTFSFEQNSLFKHFLKKVSTKTRKVSDLLTIKKKNPQLNFLDSTHVKGLRSNQPPAVPWTPTDNNECPKDLEVIVIARPLPLASFLLNTKAAGWADWITVASPLCFCLHADLPTELCNNFFHYVICASNVNAKVFWMRVNIPHEEKSTASRCWLWYAEEHARGYVCIRPLQSATWLS